MPFARVFIRRGETAAYHEAILDNIYLSLRETFDVPDEDRFMVIDEYDPGHFSFSKSYMNIARSDKFVLIQLTVSNTRPIEKKKACIAASSNGSVLHQASGRKTSSSIWWKCKRKTGHLVTVKRNMQTPCETGRLLIAWRLLITTACANATHACLCPATPQTTAQVRSARRLDLRWLRRGRQILRS